MSKTLTFTQLVPLQLAILGKDEEMINFLLTSDKDALQHAGPLPSVRFPSRNPAMSQWGIQEMMESLCQDISVEHLTLVMTED